MIKLRGTYSEGFRIPSFNEAFGAPTTGYISQQVTDPAFWRHTTTTPTRVERIASA